jgi:hypothetical protein
MQALRAHARVASSSTSQPTTLTEGSEVELVPVDDLDDDERAELDRSLRAAIAEANAGDAQLRASR